MIYERRRVSGTYVLGVCVEGGHCCSGWYAKSEVGFKFE